MVEQGKEGEHLGALLLLQAGNELEYSFFQTLSSRVACRSANSSCVREQLYGETRDTGQDIGATISLLRVSNSSDSDGEVGVHAHSYSTSSASGLSLAECSSVDTRSALVLLKVVVSS